MKPEKQRTTIYLSEWIYKKVLGTGNLSRFIENSLVKHHFSNSIPEEYKSFYEHLDIENE